MAKRLGPVEIGARLGLPASTVHAVLTRCRLNRLSHLDRHTGEQIRRYEHDHPGAMIHDDEPAATACAVLRRAAAWFTARGVTIERVLSDNGSAYKSQQWHQACANLNITVKKTRPYRPQTNAKMIKAGSTRWRTRSRRRTAGADS